MANWEVIGASRDAADSVHLTLDPAEGNGKANRATLELLDATDGLEDVIVGTTLEISGLSIRVQGKEWAEREGGAKARLVAKKKKKGPRAPA